MYFYGRAIKSVRKSKTHENTAHEETVDSQRDDFYLASLDPSHREMVLMRREQAGHMKKMECMEQERQRKEDELLKEQV